jgi:ABC-type antimicrobial peptide transport system permease subunit
MQRIQPILFLPLMPGAPETRQLQFVIRAAGDPGALPNVVRREITAAAPAAGITSTYTLDAIIAAGAQEILASTYPLIPLIAIGMLLTAAGIYGVLAFAITRRSRELAVRVAIGASRGDLVRLVSAHSARLLMTGTAIGVGVTFGLTRLVRAAGGGCSIWDAGWQSFLAPVAIIAVVGAIATWLPSRRVLKIDPAMLMRMN